MTKPVRIDLIIHRLFDLGIEFRLSDDYKIIRIDRTGPELVETEEDTRTIRHAAARLAHLVLEPGELLAQRYQPRRLAARGKGQSR